MIEPQVGRLASIQPFGIGKAGGHVLGGVARDRAGRLDGAIDGFGREIGGARVAAARPEIDGDAEPLVAVVLDGLDLAAAHGHALPDGGGNLDIGVGGAQPARRREGARGDGAHRVAR